MIDEKINSWERWLIRKVNWVSMTDGQTDICKHYRQTTLLSCYHHWKMNTMITASRGAKYQWRSIDSCLASDKKTLGIEKVQTLMTLGMPACNILYSHIYRRKVVCAFIMFDKNWAALKESENVFCSGAIE